MEGDQSRAMGGGGGGGGGGLQINDIHDYCYANFED